MYRVANDACEHRPTRRDLPVRQTADVDPAERGTHMRVVWRCGSVAAVANVYPVPERRECP